MDTQLTAPGTAIPQSYNSNHMMPPKSPGVHSKRSSYGSTRAHLGSDSEEEDTLGPKIRRPKRKTSGHSKKGKRATSLQPPDALAVVAELPGDTPQRLPSPTADTPDSSYGSMHVGDEAEHSERDTTEENKDIDRSLSPNDERSVTSQSPEPETPTAPAFSDKIVCAVSVPIPRAAFRAAPVQVHVPLRHAASSSSLLSVPPPAADPSHGRSPSISAVSMMSMEYTTGPRVLSPVSEIFEMTPRATVHRNPSRLRESHSYETTPAPVELMAERDATELDSVSEQQYQEFDNRNSMDMSYESPTPLATRRWSALPSRPEGDRILAQPPQHSQSISRTARAEYTTVTGYQTSIESAGEQLDHKTPSTPVELNGLWNAAQGAHPVNGDGKVFIMNIFRQASPVSNFGPLAVAENFSFGPTLTTSFYALQASAVPHSEEANELTVRRHNPATGDSNSVITMNISLDGTPSSDGLVTLICPKRAVMQAMRESVAHLPDNIKTQAAVNVAAETEMCKLVWSRSNQRYELRHPAIRSRSRMSQAQVIVRDAALVVKIDGKVGFDDPSAKGIIRLVNMTNMETLSTLDLGRNLLYVNTAATSKIPSKHTVDVAVTTVLAVAVVEGRRYRARMMLRRPQSLFIQPQRSPTLVSSFSPDGRTPHHPYFVDVRSPNGAASTHGGLSTHGARTMRTAPSSPKEQEQKKQNIVVKAGKGVWYVIYFIGRLVYEIIKAIIDAFRPVPKKKASSKSTSDIEGKG